jgi:predicted enzyme related to lactoylglutathione lyase
MLIADAQCVIPTKDLQADIAFFTKTLKMRMDTIYPADDPKVAVFSGHGIAICIDKDAMGSPANINLLLEAPEKFASGKTDLTAPI